MKRVLCLCVVLLMAPVLRADDAARKVIDKAIQAIGAKPDDHKKGVAWKGKGTFFGMGMELPYTGSWAIQLPDKYRMEIDGLFTVIVNGDKGWVSAMGQTMELNKEHMDEQRESLHGDYVAELTTLTDKAFTLTLVGEGKIDDKPTVAVKVTHKGYRDITLHFDKETGLTVKMDQIVKDENTGQELKQESFFRDYKKVGDRLVPMKVLVKRDGKNYVEAEVTEYKYSDKLPDETFAKPE